MSDSGRLRCAVGSLLPPVIAGLAITNCTVVLAGWAFNLARLKNIFPSRMPMRANTAIVMIGAAIALLLLRKDWAGERLSRRALVVANLFAGFMLIVGGTSLIDFLTGWDFHTYQLLFREVWRGEWRPGLTSPVAAVGALFLGCALLSINRRPVIHQTFSILTFLCGVLGILGHLLDPQVAHLGIAANSALLLMMLPLGVLSSRPECGVFALVFSNTAGGRVARWMLPSAVILPFLVSWIEWNALRGGRISSWFGVAAVSLIFTTIMLTMVLVLSLLLDRTDKRRGIAEVCMVSALEKLREAHIRINGILSGSPDPIAAIDISGKYIFFNEGYRRMFRAMHGIEPRVGESIRELVPDEAQGLPKVLACFEQALANHDLMVSESVQIEGETRWFELRLSQIEGDGQVIGVAMIGRDVTGQKRAEEALAQRHEERLHRIVGGFPGFLLLLSPDGRVVFTNRWFQEKFGDAEGRCCYDYLFGRSERCEGCQTYDILKSMAPLRWEKVGPDGRGYDLFVVPFNDCDGRTLILETGIENTQRKQAERGLQMEAGRYNALISTTSDGYWCFDREGRLLEVNDVYCRMSGYSREELMTMRIMDLDALESPDQVLRHVAGIFQHGDVFESRHRKKNGELFDVEICAAHLEATDQGMAFFRNISHRKRAEEELARRAQELARSNAELEQFAYVASHDLQEPLRMVASYTQLLASRYREQLDPTADKYIAYAVEGAQRMQTLISDLLLLSRVTTRAKPFAQVDLNQVVKTVCGLLSTIIHETGARLEVDDLPTVVADATQMQQLLQNLIGNALKFHGDQPPIVRVSGQRHSEGWTISVEDNGIGLDPKYADRIFLAFQRLHTREEYPGNGIGLAICKKIAERHDGRIWVESQEGHGAKFCLALPMRETTDTVEETDDSLVTAGR